MAGSPIFRRITLTEVKKTSNKRGSLLRELAGLEKEEKDIIKNHHDPSYSNWRSSFLIEDGMTTDGFMQTQLKGEGDTDLATIAGNVEASYQAYEGGSDALSNTAITASGTGSGSNGGFDLGKDYLAFNGNSTPRYAALKAIDSSKFDTIVVTGIRGNDNNGGEDPDETNEDLMVYYQLPGQNTIQRLDVSGGVTQSGIDYKIIPIGSDDSGLQEYSLTLPSYTRAEGVRFILYQPSHHGTGFDNYGVTQINYRRVKPISVFVSLDSPEASSFMRIGSPSKASESKKQREKQLREQLEATKDYTDKKFGENFPGSEVAAPGDEDPTEVEKRAPGLGEFEPEVEDYNTWKQETKKEDPKAQTTEKEYEKWKDDKRLKSFAAVRDAQAEKPPAAPVPKTDNKDFETVRKSLTPSGRESEKEKANVTQNVVSAVPGLEAQGVTDLGAALKASAAFDNMELSPEDEEVLDRMEDDWDAADEVNDKIIQDIGNYKVNIAKSILLNKPIYVDPDSIKVSDKMKYINAIPQNAWGSLKLGSGDGIPFVSTPLNYSDENIYVDNDGKVQMNDGSQADYTKGQGYGLPKDALDALAANVTGRNPLAMRGKAQLQVVFPPDGSEPYLRYTDHAYQNRESKGTDERPDWFTGALSDAVDKLGNLFHRAGNKDADNTDAMAGYSKNIRGDVVTEFDIPLSQLPQEMQDQIASVKKGLGVFNDAGELVKDSTVEYTGTPEQQKDLHKDLNDLYDTDPDRFMEVMQEVQDNPEYKKVEGEITTAREQFTQEKEKATTDLGAVLDQRVDLAKYMRFNSNSSDYKGTLSQYASGTVDKSTAKEIAKLGGVNLGEIDKLRKDYDLDARNKLLSKDVRQGVDSDYTWADSQPEYQKIKAAYDKARNAHSTALDNVVAASSKLNAYIKSMPDHPTKKGYVLMNSSQSAKFQKMRSEYDRLNAIESKAEAKQKSIELEPGNIRSKLVKERRAANDKIREISDKAQDNINKLYKELGDELDGLNKLATSRFDPDGELMKKQMNAWDRAAYDIMNPEYQHQQSGFQASNVGGNYAQQAVDQELQDILDRMDNLTGDDLAEYQRLLKLYNQKLNQKDPGKRTPPGLPRDEQLPPPRGFPTDPDAYQDFKVSGAGGSPGQPYTPPQEDPNNPYVPAPGRGTKLAGAGGSPGQPYTPPQEDPNNPYVPAPGRGTKLAQFPTSTASDAITGLGVKPGDKIAQADFGSISQAYGGQGVDAATLASTSAELRKKRKEDEIKARFAAQLPELEKLVARTSKAEKEAYDELKTAALDYGMDVVSVIGAVGSGGLSVLPAALRKIAGKKLVKKVLNKFKTKTQKKTDRTDFANRIQQDVGRPTGTSDTRNLTGRDNAFQRFQKQDAKRGDKFTKSELDKIDMQRKNEGLPPFKKKNLKNSYKPQGSMITEKRKLKSPHDWFNPDDIKPEYPKDPPPEMVNNYHPDLVDSAKKAERFNKLDPASAKAMPKQDDPNIDAKVEKAKKNPDKDGPEWHKKVSDKIRMARAQQR